MKKRIHYLNSACGPQRGAAIVEFALVALIFFTLVLGIMEFGRMLFIWNTVQEVTRRAAREAVVRDFSDSAEVAAIRRNAIFGGVSLPAGAEISNTNIQIRYLNGSLTTATPFPYDPAGNISTCNDATRTSDCIKFVEACVATDGTCTGSITYIPMAGLFPFLAISIPVSSVVMPAESLGFNISP